MTFWPTVIWPRNSKLSPVGFAREFHRDRQFFAEALRRAGQVLAADGEVGDKAVLAVGTLFDGVADVEHG